MNQTIKVQPRKQFTQARYERSSHLQTIHPETKALWPRRWLVFGQRVVPVALWIASLSKHQHTMGELVKGLRGQVATLEASLARQRKLAGRTQRYIEATKTRLEQSALDGLTVEEHLERERAGAREHWANPAKDSNGHVLPVGSASPKADKDKP